VLSVEQAGDKIELVVADNGIGMKEKELPKTSDKRGTDYVAIFVRQLGGTIVTSGIEGQGTTVRIRLPKLLVQPVDTRSAAA
jgi:signal transduction histidine kinase